jgi:outer membrane protein assembly factor BamA
MIRFFILLLMIVILGLELPATEIRVGNIYIERREVFDPNDPDWFFLSPLLNSLHTRTYEYIIRDELLFEENEMTDYDYLMETERNIRAIGLFTDVVLEVDSIGFNSYDIYITTKDRWSTYPALLFGTGGGEVNYGARLEEHNFAGTGTYIG